MAGITGGETASIRRIVALNYLKGMTVTQIAGALTAEGRSLNRIPKRLPKSCPKIVKTREKMRQIVKREIQDILQKREYIFLFVLVPAKPTPCMTPSRTTQLFPLGIEFGRTNAILENRLDACGTTLC